MRCTWLNDPAEAAGSGARRVVTRGREVVPQTPIVAATELAASTAPVRVSIATGTSIAIAFTEYPDTVSLATFALAASCAGVSTPPPTAARRFRVSKAAPRSIQKGSSTVPANTFTPGVPVVYVAALN